MTRKPIKYEARLNIQGGKQEYGLNYYDVFLSLITWTSLQILLILSNIFTWSTY